MREREERIEIIRTGVFITDDERMELATSTLDPNASRYGPRRRKEPYEVLQEIAERRGLPQLGDMYGLTNSGEIVCRDLPKNHKALEEASKNLQKNEGMGT